MGSSSPERSIKTQIGCGKRNSPARGVKDGASEREYCHWVRTANVVSEFDLDEGGASLVGQGVGLEGDVRTKLG